MQHTLHGPGYSVIMFLPCAEVYVWFNPVDYNVSEDAGVVTLMIERLGANGIPLNVSITTQDLNATGMLTQGQSGLFGAV